MEQMFKNATNFNNNISAWIPTSINKPPNPNGFNNMFESSGMVGNAYNLKTPTPLLDEFSQPICVGLGTQIICLKDGKECTVPVETLKAGDFVKTLTHGFLPIHTINHTTSLFTSTTKMKMLHLTSKHDSHVQGDLFITDLHPLLVEENDEKYKEDIARQKRARKNPKFNYVGEKFRLEGKHCKSFPLATDGQYTIFSIALEKQGDQDQFGMWANGLLIESTSLKYINRIKTV
jgi:hypothetical protein